MILFACKMSLGANIITRSWSGSFGVLRLRMTFWTGWQSGVLGGVPLGEGEMEDLPLGLLVWILRLRLRMTNADKER